MIKYLFCFSLRSKIEIDHKIINSTLRYDRYTLSSHIDSILFHHNFIQLIWQYHYVCLRRCCRLSFCYVCMCVKSSIFSHSFSYTRRHTDDCLIALMIRTSVGYAFGRLFFFPCRTRCSAAVWRVSSFDYTVRRLFFFSFQNHRLIMLFSSLTVI